MSSDKNDSATTRRGALALGAAAALGLNSAKALAQKAEGQPLIGNPQLPEVPGNKMRWAILGLGTFGVGQVIPGFADARHSRMTAFISGNRDKAEMLGARYGVQRLYDYESFDSIADDPEIDCVYKRAGRGRYAKQRQARKRRKHHDVLP